MINRKSKESDDYTTDNMEQESEKSSKESANFKGGSDGEIVKEKPPSALDTIPEMTVVADKIINKQSYPDETNPSPHFEHMPTSEIEIEDAAKSDHDSYTSVEKSEEPSQSCQQ
jgi:hypothetical protein